MQIFCKSLVMSVLMNGRKIWCDHADIIKKIQSFNNKYYRQIVKTLHKRLKIIKWICPHPNYAISSSIRAISQGLQNMKIVMLQTPYTKWHTAQKKTSQRKAHQGRWKKRKSSEEISRQKVLKNGLALTDQHLSGEQRT